MQALEGEKADEESLKRACMATLTIAKANLLSLSLSDCIAQVNKHKCTNRSSLVDLGDVGPPHAFAAQVEGKRRVPLCLAWPQAPRSMELTTTMAIAVYTYALILYVHTHIWSCHDQTLLLYLPNDHV
jgi:hypothetical protein